MKARDKMDGGESAHQNEKRENREPRHEECLPREEQLNRNMHRCGHYLYHHAVGPRQTLVVQLLKEHTSMTQKEIQEALEIQAGSVSELLTKLESKGIIERQRLDKDRRKVLITLTQSGQKIPATDKAATLKERYRALDEEEQETLIRLLQKLLDDWIGEG